LWRPDQPGAAPVRRRASSGRIARRYPAALSAVIQKLLGQSVS
jgi:hypothetical protein